MYICCKFNLIFFDVGDYLYFLLDCLLLCVVVDIVGVYDVNVFVCDDICFMVDFNVVGYCNCLDNMYEGLVLYGLLKFDVLELFNLFQNGLVMVDCCMQVIDFISKLGDYIIFEVLEDLLCVVLFCLQDIIFGNGLCVIDIVIFIYDVDLYSSVVVFID